MSAHIPRGALVAAAASLFSALLGTLPLPASAQAAASSQWSTYIGGADVDRITAIAQNSSRDVVAVGTTRSMNLAEPPNGGTRASTDIFLSGFEYDGALHSDFTPRILGGAADDTPTAAAFGNDGALYIVGTSASSTMTGAGSLGTTFKGGTDAFLIRIGSSGAAEWYTYMGGIDIDAATGVTVIGNSVYVSGWTNSSDFMGAAQNPSPNTVNAFVVRVDVNPTTPSAIPNIGWNGQPRIFGGEGHDVFNGITSNQANMLIAVGTTNSATTDLRTTYGARLKNDFKGGESDAWVVAVETEGGDPRWMSYVGGNQKDEGKAIARGKEDTFVIAGNTASTDIVLPPPALSNVFGAWFTFNGGMRLIQVRGGDYDEEALAATVDDNGTAYIGGKTASSNLPRVSLGFDVQIEAGGATPPPMREGFVWMFPAWGGAGWDSFAGSTMPDEVTALSATVPTQLMLGMGTSSGSGLPGSIGPRDGVLSGGSDGYLLSVKVEEPTQPQGGMVNDRLGPDDVLEDVEETTSRDSLFANWTEFTYGGGPVDLYEWAIGTLEYPTSVRPFGPVTGSLRSQASGLNLAVGQKYVVTVRGQNRVGLTRGVQSSGVVVTLPDGGLGEPDGGMGEPDGGSGEPDGGANNPDGGSSNPDGGTGNTDGGTGDGPDDGKGSPLGWGCASAGGAGVPLLLGLIALMLLARRLGQLSR